MAPLEQLSDGSICEHLDEVEQICLQEQLDPVRTPMVSALDGNDLALATQGAISAHR